MINTQATGTLYIVATPIGNREDITQRALTILHSVDLVLAEDTRHSKQLLTALGIKKKLSSMHAHNEHEKSQQIITFLQQGLSVALISDAGTPLISDPGFFLVRLARQHDISVIPIPGCCALITALSAAGIACDSFLFLGFLPAKQKARQDKLLALRNEPYTLIFYESTHRIHECIDDVIALYGADCELVLAKELTKAFERFLQTQAGKVKQWLSEAAAHAKGEFVLIIPPRQQEEKLGEEEKLLTVLLAEVPLKQAVAIASQLSTKNKNDLYQMALKLKG